eukprot:gb/GEZN01009620.1/.p1 GENE.gb/GEZN01009620.1/~~gb/GEZN01009620.1/.p1  ORF type:complete len:297 (-),score=21.01 gb/GEZN01009620.1/:380-1270(-)
MQDQQLSAQDGEQKAARNQAMPTQDKQYFKKLLYYDYIKQKRGYELGQIILMGAFFACYALIPFIVVRQSVKDVNELEKMLEADLVAMETKQYTVLSCLDLASDQLFLVDNSIKGNCSILTFQPWNNYNTSNAEKWNAVDALAWKWKVRKSVRFQSWLRMGLPTVILFAIKEIGSYVRSYHYLHPHFGITPYKLQRAQDSIFFRWFLLVCLISFVFCLNYATFELYPRANVLYCTVGTGEAEKSLRKFLIVSVVLVEVLGVPVFLKTLYLYLTTDEFGDLLLEHEFSIVDGKLRRI